MEISLLLTIIGLSATFIFGFLSIDLFKRKRYPGKITFVKQSSISLFNSIVKNFNEISILFDNIPIKENLIYIKGCFINDGDIDIEGDKIEKSITIELPKNYKWINCKITDTSKDLKCTYNFKNETDLQFDFGLFRKNEFYQLEALIEAKRTRDKSVGIFESMKFSHRISQTQKITTTNLLTEDQMKKKKNGIFRNIWVTALQLLLPTILGILLTVFLKSAELHYQIIENGKTIEYKATPKRDATVELKNMSTDVEKIISISEFQDKSKYIPFIPQKTIWQRFIASWYMLVAWLFLVSIFVGVDSWELRKNNKIYGILKSSE
jgi:hypothetical protein